MGDGEAAPIGHADEEELWGTWRPDGTRLPERAPRSRLWAPERRRLPLKRPREPPARRARPSKAPGKGEKVKKLKNKAQKPGRGAPKHVLEPLRRLREGLSKGKSCEELVSEALRLLNCPDAQLVSLEGGGLMIPELDLEVRPRETSQREHFMALLLLQLQMLFFQDRRAQTRVMQGARERCDFTT